MKTLKTKQPAIETGAAVALTTLPRLSDKKVCGTRTESIIRLYGSA